MDNKIDAPSALRLQTLSPQSGLSLDKRNDVYINRPVKLLHVRNVLGQALSNTTANDY